MSFKALKESLFRRWTPGTGTIFHLRSYRSRIESQHLYCWKVFPSLDTNCDTLQFLQDHYLWRQFVNFFVCWSFKQKGADENEEIVTNKMILLVLFNIHKIQESNNHCRPWQKAENSETSYFNSFIKVLKLT